MIVIHLYISLYNIIHYIIIIIIIIDLKTIYIYYRILFDGLTLTDFIYIYIYIYIVFYTIV